MEELDRESMLLFFGVFLGGKNGSSLKHACQERVYHCAITFAFNTYLFLIYLASGLHSFEQIFLSILY